MIYDRLVSFCLSTARRHWRKHPHARFLRSGVGSGPEFSLDVFPSDPSRNTSCSRSGGSTRVFMEYSRLFQALGAVRLGVGHNSRGWGFRFQPVLSANQ